MMVVVASEENMWPATNLLHFTDREYILFNFWKSGTSFGMLGSMLIVFLIAVLHEAVAGTRLFFVQEQTPLGLSREHLYENTNERRESSTDLSGLMRFCRRVMNWFRLGNALLYGLQWTLMCILILFICTFNVYIIMSVICGKTVGYFVFVSGSPVADQAMTIEGGRELPQAPRRACR